MSVFNTNEQIKYQIAVLRGGRFANGVVLPGIAYMIL